MTVSTLGLESHVRVMMVVGRFSERTCQEIVTITMKQYG